MHGQDSGRISQVPGKVRRRNHLALRSAAARRIWAIWASGLKGETSIKPKCPQAQIALEQRRSRSFGTLVSDRYQGYNVFEGKRQFCFEHLKRKCKSLLEKEPENKEYLKFVPMFIDLLIQAMTLRNRAKTDCEYYDEANRLQVEIMKMANAQARDPALQEFQCIFRENEDKLFQWVENRDVPADNNLSERGVRKTVIARKTCFGSQGDKGLSDREVVQSVVMTTYLRYADPVAKLTEVLDAYAADQSVNIADLLFPVKAEQGKNVATGAGAPSEKKERGEAA